jgi:hypothetical protein
MSLTYAERRTHRGDCTVQMGFSTCSCQTPVHISKIIPGVMEEIKMAALPSVVHLDTKPLEAKYKPTLTGFAARIEDLNARVAKIGRITGTIAAEAQELDTEAKRWLEVWDAETEPTKKSLFTAHRNFTAFCAKFSAGATNARDCARRLIGTYQMEQLRKADAERREAERLAREEAEAQKQVGVEALEKLAIETDDPALALAAAEMKAAPAIPVLVPEVAPARVEGHSVSYKLVGTVMDPVQLLIFLLGPWCDERDPEHPTIDYRPRVDLINELIGDWSQSGINAALKRGLPLPGVKVERQAITRNLSRR